MARVIAYVDGFNLYFGLKNAGFKRLYWLDVAALAGNLLKPGQTLAATRYFTARIRDNGRNTADRKRQGDYLEALGLSGTSIQLGHYLEKQRSCRKCHAAWTDYEEKMTDVNIAIQLLNGELKVSDTGDGTFHTIYPYPQPPNYDLNIFTTSSLPSLCGNPSYNLMFPPLFYYMWASAEYVPAVAASYSLR